MFSVKQRGIYIVEVEGKKVAFDPLRVYRRYVSYPEHDPELDGKIMSLSGEDHETLKAKAAATERTLKALRYAFETPEVKVEDDGTVVGFDDATVFQIWMNIVDYFDTVKKNTPSKQNSPKPTGRASCKRKKA